MVSRQHIKHLVAQPKVRRVIILKLVISATFIAYLIDHSLAMPASVIGNFLWLWVPADIPHIEE